MLKRPHYIAFSLVVLLVLILVSLPDRTATQFKLAFSSLFLPLFGLADSAQTLAEHASHALTPRRVLLTQLEQLRRENSQFRVRETQVAEILRQNERLSEALRRQKQLPWKLQVARVISRDPANWWRTVQIDVGQRHGLVLDTPVLALDGQLVGRVRQLGPSSARVALVGDPECGVSAVVEDAGHRDFGVIASSTANVLDSSMVELTYVNRPKASKPGQRVITSGLGGVFPPGILIGHIVDTNIVGFGLYAEARVKLGANLDSLNEVWVILPELAGVAQP